jgi:hypothetical protein
MKGISPQNTHTKDQRVSKKQNSLKVGRKKKKVTISKGTTATEVGSEKRIWLEC